MAVLSSRLLSLTLILLFLPGCQVGYLIENAYYQADILLKRVPLKKAVDSPDYSEQTKAKLHLVQRAKEFAETKLNLKATNNYSSFVQLKTNYIVHSLTVAPRDKLEPYQWSFPFFGSFPYLGYFNKESALKAQKKFQDSHYDTYLRGVSAFSTLGWFDDPILSTMMNYSDYDLVNLIIHETVHATIYIKNAVDFNERLATYIGNIGTEIFYREAERTQSKTLAEASDQSVDDQVFSDFLSRELTDLKKWYEEQKSPPTEDMRSAIFNEMKLRFTQTAMPKLKTKAYTWFADAQLNNARLLSYQTYYKDLGDFQKLFEKLSRDPRKLIEFCKGLEKSEKPEDEVKRFTGS